jgi:hypothetical protein
VVRNRSSIELLKILSDDAWHNTSYLALAAGKYISPERASRTSHDSEHLPSVARGRYHCIYRALQGFMRTGRIERRRGDGDKTSEWRLVDREWAEKMVSRVGEQVRPALMMVDPASPGGRDNRRCIHLRPADYNALLEAKLTYENGKDTATEWGAFLLLLLGFALGGSLIKLKGATETPPAKPENTQDKPAR